MVEGVKAGLAYFEKKVTSMEDDWSGVAIGYSQGGAVAAGVLRYCQEHNETSLRLKGAICGDGPYDPLATLKRYIEMDKLYMPVAPALLLKGAIDTDPDMIALTYQSKTTLHVGTGRAFYLRYSGGLVDEILDNKRSPREETIGGGLWAEQK